MRKLLVVVLLLALVSLPTFAARQGRFDRYIIGINGTAVAGATVEVRRQGATAVQGAQNGSTPITINVVAPGQIQTADQVVIGTASSPSYTVGTVTATTIQLTAGGAISLAGGERLSPTNALPTLYLDSNGVTTKPNPLTTSSKGQAGAWVGDGIYDFKVSGAGVVTFLSEDYWIGGIQKAEANTWTALQTFSAGVSLPSVTVAPGNLISVDGNDTNLTPDPTCANSGTAGMITLLDSDESATDSFRMCVGTSDYFVIPQVGSDVADTAQILIGQGTNSAAWIAMSGEVTITSGGVATVTAGALNVKVEEMDASPSVAATSSVRFPNNSLSTAGEAANVIRVQVPINLPSLLSGIRYTASSMGWCTGNNDDSDQLMSANNMYYFPMYVQQSVTANALGLRVDSNAPAAGGGATAILALYDSVADPNSASYGLPNNRLVNSAALAIDPNNTTSEDAAITPTALAPGWYWISYVGSLDATINAMAAVNCRSLGILAAGNLKANVGIKKAFAYGTPPASAGVTTADFSPGTGSTLNVPQLWFKVQ